MLGKSLVREKGEKSVEDYFTLDDPLLVSIAPF